MNEFLQKGWSRTSLDRLIHNMDAHDITDRRPGSGHLKSARTTDNIAFVQELICGQDDTPHLYTIWRTLS